MPPISGAPRRVIVVDNDEITLLGTVAALERFGQLQVVAGVSHDKAIAWQAEWRDIDVAVIDASDTRREGDQFPGVAVVRAARRCGSPSLLIVVVTGQWGHDGLRLRMHQAGADFFYERQEGMTSSELVRTVLNPEASRRLAGPLPKLPKELGIGPSTAVNDLVEILAACQAHSALGDGTRKKSSPHSPRSRWWDALRAASGGPRGLVPTTADGQVTNALRSPSVPQLRKVWQALARTTKEPS